MSGAAKAIKIPIVVAAIVSLLTLPAYAQGLSKKGGRGAPAESHPKIDEKAYKAALDRIPTPNRGTIPGARYVLPSQRKQRASRISNDLPPEVGPRRRTQRRRHGRLTGPT
jgi:hypothetical protein